MPQGQILEQQPLSDINTTPLIDVLLVLLIMFIITIPLQSHAVKLDLASGPPLLDTNTVRNMIVVTGRGALMWNDQPVSHDGLERQLAAVGAMPKQPEVHL